MSDNRRRTGNEAGFDCPEELSFEQFLARCLASPIVRIQGRAESTTRRRGQLVRFNRSVRVDIGSARINAKGEPYVRVERVRWDWRKLKWVRTNRWFTATWRLLDWITWQATGDPNGTWVKVTDKYGVSE